MKTLLFKWPGLIKYILNVWPPFFFTGIKVEQFAANFMYSKVALKWRPWTLNANATQFGGSIFSMTDGLMPIMLMGVLGKEYQVWDKQAEIDFIQPGVGRLWAEFNLTPEFIEEVKEKTHMGDKFLPSIKVEIRDKKNNLVSTVYRTLYIRKKQRYSFHL